MIAYEELVAALTQWRERNGLPTMPAELGAPVPAAAYRAAPVEPVEVYDDSDLLVDEQSDVGHDPYATDDGGIQQRVEMTAEGHDPATQYDDPPSTDMYGDYGAAPPAAPPAYDDDFDDGFGGSAGADSTVVAEGVALQDDARYAEPAPNRGRRLRRCSIRCSRRRGHGLRRRSRRPGQRHLRRGLGRHRRRGTD